jgi:hypothetical protein
MRKRCMRPPVYASSSCPLSRRTVNCELGSVSITVPFISTASLLGNGSFFPPTPLRWIGHEWDRVPNSDWLRASAQARSCAASLPSVRLPPRPASWAD